jgi:phosphoribosylglycinamide formyltransferase-1
MQNKIFKVAIFASGNGTNAEAIMRYFEHHDTIEVALLLSNNPEAYALRRAEKFGVDTRIFNRLEIRETTIILDWLAEKEITHIVLAGFLWLVPQYLTEAFPNRIINIHPALLPKFGGKGMYGARVHEAVKAMNETETGITIHLVNENYDEGRVISQFSCPVDPLDTPASIAEKVHRLEYHHYPATIEQWITGKA